ncbi:mucin-associated surface protein [Cryobacterium suzukii]|uniref:Mucin-associated surface protein n=1 Tax=Cryobacterium suzukii TaxID=1259198 RepID=A0A4V3ISH5_9MICO|nr:mucin-associated surface protein [Cryobacterium suzukii]TFD58834.1 mucin-associated surface protein [Cryobacterium suzukii]
MNRRHRLPLAALLLLLPLTGCTATAVDLQAVTAEQLQTEILAISEASADGDFADAQSLLTAMQANLRTAAASGQVSAERSASIQSAINLVRDDLTVEIDAAVVAEEAAAKAAEEAAAAQQNDEDAKDRAEQAKDDAENAKKDAENAKENREDRDD